MAEEKILKKISPLGSLAQRVLLICLFLLVIPLFLHTLLLYQSGYQKRLEDAKSTLQAMGEGQKALIEEILEMKWEILEAVSVGAVQKLQSLQVSQMALPDGVEGRFAYPSKVKKSLVVGVGSTHEKALVVLIPFQKLIDQLSHFENVPVSLTLAPISFALLGDNGDLLAGKEPLAPLSVRIPIQDSHITLLLSVSQREIQAIHKTEVFFRFASLLFFFGVLGGLLVWLLTRRVAKPLKNLCGTMERVSEGATHVRYKPDWMGFEINQLGKQFNLTLDALLKQQQETERERIGREKLAQELRIGHEIQSNLLPTRIPEIKEIDIASGYLPAKEVGGDFYDLFLLENGLFFIAIADTAGKGISACLYSLGLRSSLKSFAAVSSDLSEIVLRANDLFWMDAKNTGMFVTLWAAIYDPKTKKLTYCNQGHTPPFLIRERNICELTTGGIAIGAQKLDVISTESVTLQENDLLFLFTDGVIEAHDSDNQLFGSHRLREFFFRNEKKSPSQIIENLLEEIHLFAQAAPQHDDLTALALRFK